MVGLPKPQVWMRVRPDPRDGGYLNGARVSTEKEESQDGLALPEVGPSSILALVRSDSREDMRSGPISTLRDPERPRVMPLPLRTPI
jgi:hypothetical protein